MGGNPEEGLSRRRANVVLAVVDFPVSPSEPVPFPWRRAAIVAAAVAAVELLLLLVVGGALLAKPATAPRASKQHAAVSPARSTPAPARAHRRVAADLPRRKVSLLILNGNGRQGAAADAATRVRHRGYRVRSVGNAANHTYPRSLVMYRRGFEGEGVRLARDLGIRVVGPLDGMRPRQLHGAHAVVILGG